jgi:ADP-ribose pyrophosphatase YjhB (NUDIX family)
MGWREETRSQSWHRSRADPAGYKLHAALAIRRPIERGAEGWLFWFWRSNDRDWHMVPDTQEQVVPPSTRLRRSARIFLFDPAGNILLIRFVVERDGGTFVFWVTPGGEVESGEGDREAAERELFEELGLRLPLVGPVHEASGGTYVHLGETVRNFDVFFAAECTREAPRLIGVTADEIALMQEARWWSLEEIEATAERLFPVDMARVIRDIRTGK